MVNLQAQADDLFNQGMKEIEAGQYDTAWQTFGRAREAKGDWSGYGQWYVYLSIRLGENALYDNDHDTALRYFNTALRTNGDLPSNEGNQFDRIYIQRLIDLTKEHAISSGKTPEYIHRVFALYIKNVDINDTMDGKPVTCKETLSNGQIEGAERNQKLLRFYVETLTAGKVSLSFEGKVVDAPVTKVAMIGDYPTPDINSATESQGPILFESRNRFDSIFYYYNTCGFADVPHAGSHHPLYIPYTWSGKSRGLIAMPMGKGNDNKSEFLSRYSTEWVHFHEFFHIIEVMSDGKISPMHAFLKENLNQARINFPKWVPDMNPLWTATEYSWYRHQIQNTLPAQLEKKAIRTGLFPSFQNFGFLLTDPDPTEDYVFKVYSKAEETVSLDNLRRASELVNSAESLRQKNRNDEAISMFKKALTFNPYHHLALQALGNNALKQKQIEEASGYYEKLAAIFPDPRVLFSIALSFLQQNEFSKAARFFSLAADRADSNPVYQWWQTKAFLAAGDSAANALFAKLQSNPVVQAQTAFITNASTGQALYSDAAPDDSPSVSLAAPWRHDGFAWKLVKTDGDFVRIVSGYNWSCLEARPGKGSYVVVQSRRQDIDAQKWQLLQGRDGVYQIISKVSGTPLVVLKTSEKQFALSLSGNGADVFGGWKLELQDPALDIVSLLPPLGLVSGLTKEALDLYQGDVSDGATIGLWANDMANPYGNQRWKIVPSGEADYVFIVSGKSWKGLIALEQADGIRLAQTNVNGSPAQKWRLVQKTPGQYQIVNKAFGRALEVDPGQQRQLRLGEINDSAGQLWKQVK